MSVRVYVLYFTNCMSITIGLMNRAGLSLSLSQSLNMYICIYGEVVRGIMIRMQQYHLREFHP